LLKVHERRFVARVGAKVRHALHLLGQTLRDTRRASSWRAPLRRSECPESTTGTCHRFALGVSAPVGEVFSMCADGLNIGRGPSAEPCRHGKRIHV
jgi:hypothetical protein